MDLPVFYKLDVKIKYTFVKVKFPCKNINKKILKQIEPSFFLKIHGQTFEIQDFLLSFLSKETAAPHSYLQDHTHTVFQKARASSEDITSGCPDIRFKRTSLTSDVPRPKPRLR